LGDREGNSREKRNSNFRLEVEFAKSQGIKKIVTWGQTLIMGSNSDLKVKKKSSFQSRIMGIRALGEVGMNRLVCKKTLKRILFILNNWRVSV
jgi:hypothetical protein